ncbi:hypothetical protein IFM89_019789 [Coptis chinensis]|uniref:Neprosin PEP catalytic domain-containing protein n=1 Tax=Coptis chinensis TaxID=261450 RepID=A0A835IBV1_9MAGN|nr:hypothetical protein IFM89_019789 [Coptis chinensis]
MALKVCLTLLVVLFMKLQHLRAEGNRSLTWFEGLELEEQLKILNKQFVKSVQVEAGHVFDCIEINKQPALDHPLLKDHKIQMKPTILPDPNGVLDKASSDTGSRTTLKSINCPKGTVPIRRTRKEDLIRAKALVEERFTDISADIPRPGQHLAIVRSKLDNGEFEQFHGTEALMNVIRPGVTEDGQSSSSLIWVERGTIAVGDVDQVIAGWTVDPVLYGDDKTHFVTFWNTMAGGRNTGGCFNLLCPGFVQVDHNYPVDQVFSNVSVYDGAQLERKVSIYQDHSNNWWVELESIKIGYWPNKILPRLYVGADHVGWGGLTRVSKDGILSPPMGFGNLPDGVYRRSGYFQYIKVFNALHEPVQPYGKIDTFVETRSCYQIKNEGFTRDKGYAFTYGGPGGQCG